MSQPHVAIGNGNHQVLVLSGWFGSSGAWNAILPNLNVREFKYIFADYRGYGKRISEDGKHTLAEAAQDALELADELGFEKISIIGHSMGGAVMQRILADAPERIRSLVGISPVPACGVPFDDETWAVFSGAAKSSEMRKGIIDNTTGSRLSEAWLDSMVKHSFKNSTEEAFGEYLVAWAKTDFHKEIIGNQVPVKVIFGEHDPAISAPVVDATFAAWYPNCDVEEFSNCGHYAMEETPVALVSSIERFLLGLN